LELSAGFCYFRYYHGVGTPWTPTPADLKQAYDRGGPYWVWAEPFFNKVGLTTIYRPVEVDKLNKAELEMIAAKKAGIRYGGSSSFEIRSLVWQGAVELGRRRPIFGYGPETFGYTYYNVRPAAHNLNSEWDFLYNKAHNEYLNFLANTGFDGLASYLNLLVSILYFFKCTMCNVQSAIYKNALTVGFISILITNYFGFSVVIVAVYLFLFPALLLVSNSKNRSFYSLNINFNKPLLFTLFFILFTYCLVSPIQQFRADLAYNKGKVLLQYQNIKESIKYLTTATELNAQEPLFPALLAEAQASAVVAIKQQLDALPATASASIKAQGQQMIDGFIQEATANAKKAVNMNKYHTLLYKSKAKSELYIGLAKPEYNQKALDTLIELSALAPTDAKIYYNIGLLYDQLTRPSDAQLAYQQAVLLKPDYQEPKSFLLHPPL
jgi:tetratricopeptide (TPR) repeat protein